MAKKEAESVSMRVRVGENELEVTGPCDFVEKKIAEFLEQQKSVHTVSTTKSARPATQTLAKPTKEMSAAQFFKKVSPKNDVDRTLAAGYFLEKFRNVENFTAADVAHIIRSDAKTPPPKNPNDAVNKNIRKGSMMSAGDKDGKMAFVLTSDGEEAIEALLNA
ncbi:MAG TPA: hypothetical protein ACFYD2_00785 [Candidatus Avalokitesvara rifleensis]|uniref:hypothetical protein n=1 Tax=Candidatus Avalokitesvara rifleensis TaxID=3367620 RepID=UPI002713B77F|nr:hypothetical protein [Candidatus Brocadiales bacterium]